MRWFSAAGSSRMERAQRWDRVSELRMSRPSGNELSLGVEDVERTA
jgi:hypothetical protein